MTTSQYGTTGGVTCVSGDTFCISGHSGQVRRGTEHGLYVREVRALDQFTITLDGAEPLVLTGHGVGGAGARFAACRAFRPADQPDPTVLLDRRRAVSGSLLEDVRLRNVGRLRLTLDVEMTLGSDFSDLFAVKHQQPSAPVPARLVERGLSFESDGHTTLVGVTPPADHVNEPRGRLLWHVALEPGEQWHVEVEVSYTDALGTSRPDRSWDVAVRERPTEAVPWTAPVLRCTDKRFDDLLLRSVTDLGSLLLEDPEAPGDRFAAAGSPWYLTLFGRDSLWTARMALPLGVELARGTLRALARRQGRRHDPAIEEAPGKILHEVRTGGLSARSVLPPRYYGSMDATPLFVTLLHEAWRWGLDEGEVAGLLPAAEGALEWLATSADPDGDGFLEYARRGVQGLVNQGWKDSVDGVQFADGTLARAPIALCEVQAYAYEAAWRGAQLLERFDRPGADRWRSWAADLRVRFRRAFWVEDGQGPFPAIALDRDDRPVDSVTSNIGHLLATGLLDPGEEELVAARLEAPELHSGWGLRTLSARSARFNPLSYHGGSVWPHDTAIAVAGLAAGGHVRAATSLLHALLDAAVTFDLRLPELFGGEQREAGLEPLTYPAACRPQAWASAASLLLLRAVLGIDAHVPAGRITLRPMWPPPFARLRVEGIALGAGQLGVEVDATDGVRILTAPPGVEVSVEGPQVPVLSAR